MKRLVVLCLLVVGYGMGCGKQALPPQVFPKPVPNPTTSPVAPSAGDVDEGY